MATSITVEIPHIIQGGMGVGVSGWRLAQAVSRLGQLGVVSGTGLDQVLVRRLQDGDIGENIRRALSHFPLPRIVERVLDEYFIPAGRATPNTPYRRSPMHTLEGNSQAQELSMLGNFAEIFLAREGHSNPVGINYLEKIQLPHLPSLYGAMLAGVAVVLVGAGIPAAFPAAMHALSDHQPASYPVRIIGGVAGEAGPFKFDPGPLWDGASVAAALMIPHFLPIVSSSTLAKHLCRQNSGDISGFIVEGSTAGGHNAPPRDASKKTADGQPLYGPRDCVDPKAMSALGKPFWMAGSYGTPEGLQKALAMGASGIQVGTLFALCEESGFPSDVKRALIERAIDNKVDVFTDPAASPTGFPFKVVPMAGTLSEDAVYRARRRVCDLGALRDVYRRENGTVGYRCPAEPEASYTAKGGDADETRGRRCLCNSLVANIGIPQALSDGSFEKCLVTLGDDTSPVRRLCTGGRRNYTAAQAIEFLLGCV